MLDWTNILSMAFGGAGIIGAVVTLVNLRATKKKANAEADGAVVDALNAAIDGLRDTISELRDMQNESDARDEKKNELIKEKDALIADLQKHLADKRCENTTKGYYMCVHQGCVVRRPSLGRGKEYFASHEKEYDFGADFTPIEDLIEEYRRRKEADA